ncbi:MAG: transcription termination/antitermination NusG family protein [Bacteroidales bacterium]
MIQQEDHNWHALKTLPHKEEQVLYELEIKNFKSYLPQLCYYTSSKKQRTKPLIPGYVMVYACWRDFEKLRYIRGSKGLLMINGNPGKITDGEMDFLKHVCGNLSYKPELDNYRAGDKIRILSGILKGHTGVVAATDRNKIGIDLCQGSFRVWINAGSTVFEII